MDDGIDEQLGTHLKRIVALEREVFPRKETKPKTVAEEIENHLESISKSTYSSSDHVRNFQENTRVRDGLREAVSALELLDAIREKYELETPHNDTLKNILAILRGERSV